MKYKSILTYVWFRHQGHLGPVPKFTEVNKKPATYPGDSGSEPESIFHSEFPIYYGVGFFSIFRVLSFLIASLLLFLSYYTNILIPQFPIWHAGRQATFCLHQRGVDRNLTWLPLLWPAPQTGLTQRQYWNTFCRFSEMKILIMSRSWSKI